MKILYLKNDPIVIPANTPATLWEPWAVPWSVALLTSSIGSIFQPIISIEDFCVTRGHAKLRTTLILGNPETTLALKFSQITWASIAPAKISYWV